MGRVVKDPEVRRKELIDVAEALFIEKGFDETSVSDIVKKAGVAQGTFYYYFKTKEDILNAIVDEFMGDIIKIIDQALEDENLNAVQKIFKIFSVSIEYRKTHNGKERIADVVHDEKHELLHSRLKKANTPVFEDMMYRIILQGIEEGLFNTEFPEEASIAIVATMTEMGHGDKGTRELSPEEKLRFFYAFLDLMERILGAKKGAFKDMYKMVEEYK